MAGGIQARAHQGDQGASEHQQQHRHSEQPRPHQGVDCCQHVGALLAGPAGQHAHHGAVERSVNAAQQDQQKAGQHVGVVVGVVSRANAEGCCNGLLPHQAGQLAEGSGHCHNKGNAPEGL